MTKDSKVIFRIPISLHADFKDACAILDVGMSDVLRQMVAQFCAENGIISESTKTENESNEEDQEG